MGRRVRYSVAASLDGFIATPDGGYDWIPSDPAIDFAAFLSDIDTVLMGRRTYEVVRQGGGISFEPPIRTYVFSRSLAPNLVPDAILVSDDPAGFVRALALKEGKDIWLFGGGQLFGSLLRSGMVDTVEVAIVPVLLGEGMPILPIPGRIPLHLERTEEFPSGIILNRYRVMDRRQDGTGSP